MTDTHDPSPLSNLQLLVLARVSCSDGATMDEMAAAVTELAPPDGSASAREHASSALEALRRRSLVATSSPTSRTAVPRWKLTAEGGDVLRAGFGLDQAPSWSAVKARYVPALALGIAAGSEQASKLGNSEQLALAVLRQRFDIDQGSTLIRLCDALIAKALGFTGQVTLLRLRAHVLVRELGLEPRVTSTKELEALAQRAASQVADPSGEGKRPLRQGLGRRWAYRVVGSSEVAPGPRLVASPSEQASLPLDAVSSAFTGQRTPPPPPDPPPAVAVATPGDILLTLVREAIPHIGSDGRFGDEKVFVSAIWHHLEDDGRLADWSLDRFKRWLVTANRDQLLDLARADAQGDMDGRLVEDSEIIDQGATFHFVVDRRALSSRRGLHAR